MALMDTGTDDGVEDTDDDTTAADGEAGVTAGLGEGTDTRPGPCPGGGWLEVISRGFTLDGGVVGAGPGG